MVRIRSGSVVCTDNGAVWYCCGDWRLKGFPDGVPCILGYIPLSEALPVTEKTKILHIGDYAYTKAFGQPLSVYRTAFLGLQRELIHSPSFGKVVFVKHARIVEVHDPPAFTADFLARKADMRELVQSLAVVLGVPFESIAIGGSTMVTRGLVRRHEIDVGFYGHKWSRKAFRAIEQQRNDTIFSCASLPPFHLPFRYRGVWFDPQFSEGERERHFLRGATIHRIRHLGEQVLSIRDDRDGIFFPAVYGVQGRKRLISFRTGHRGLFRRGQQVRFTSLSLIRLTYRTGRTEVSYGVLDDEWGEIQSTHK